MQEEQRDLGIKATGESDVDISKRESNVGELSKININSEEAKMELLKGSKIINCYPGGNDTYLVFNPKIVRSEYGAINNDIMSQNERLGTAFEQGGFIESATNKFAVGRLQMAGGEFCGNATRSFAAALIEDYLNKREFRDVVRYDLIRREGDTFNLQVEVSGSDKLLEVAVVQSAKGYDVTVEIPVRPEFRYVENKELTLEGQKVSLQVATLEGITHVIVTEDNLSFPQEEASRIELAKKVIAELGLSSEPAVGVIWKTVFGESYRIDPIVWVKSIDTYFYESACGSGSVAVGLADALEKNASGKHSLKIKQPSGFDIDVSVEFGANGSKFSRAFISGEVILRGELLQKESETIMQARTLKGFKDRMPAEAIRKASMLSALREVFERFGYGPIETPHLEYAACLLGGASQEIKKQLYRFNDKGGRDVLLRFDLTVPLARFISQHRGELGLPFKRWAIGNVFRGENPQAGRFREFTQCDFDLVGAKSIGADVEIIEVMSASMKALGVDDYTIRVNNRKLMNSVASALGVGEKSAEILQTIDKIDKVGTDAVFSELVDGVWVPRDTAETLLEFVALSKNSQPLDTISKARRCDFVNKEIESALDELEQLTGILAYSGYDMRTLKIDFSIARGLGYYTGIVYEATLNKLPELGSVCSGGRYDNLTQSFSKERISGVGASVGLDRLMVGLEKLGLGSEIQTPAKVLITIQDENNMAHAHGLARVLRDGGLNIEIYPDAAKPKKVFKYADQRGHPFVISLDNDIGSISLYNIATKSRVELPSTVEGLAQAISMIKDGGTR